MSRVYFHTQYGTAELSGAERSYASIMASDILSMVFNVMSNGMIGEGTIFHKLEKNPEDTIFRTKMDPRTLSLWVRMAISANRQPEILNEEGKPYPLDMFAVALNTMYKSGSDAVKLLARIHGQCEIHCWFEGKNRKWVADIIQRGRIDNVLRPNEGWEEVRALLLERYDCPVVMSYSVCRSFPSLELVDNGTYPDYIIDEETGESIDKYDIWDEKSDEDKWAECMPVLRELSNRGLEISPDNWQNYYFGDGISGHELMRDLEKENLQKREENDPGIEKQTNSNV